MNDRDFFNSLAEEWDDTRGLNQERLTELVNRMNIAAADQILDIGSGTGALLPFLYLTLGATGSITALDFAEAMIFKAKEKHSHYDRINFVASDILKYNPRERFDKIVCLNFYPHVRDKAGFFQKISQLLQPRGYFFIMHDISRAAVNAIHGQSDVVKEDCLETAEKVAELLETYGFVIKETTDDDTCYFISAQL